MGVQAKRYLLSIYQPAGAIPPTDMLQTIMRDVNAVNQELKAAGAWVFGGGLQSLEVAKVARPKAGKVQITDGPFAETREFLGGFCIITAPDLDSAAEWGAKLARATTLPIEVRPFREDKEVAR
jgi:hypothetical protein